MVSELVRCGAGVEVSGKTVVYCSYPSLPSLLPPQKSNKILSPELQKGHNQYDKLAFNMRRKLKFHFLAFVAPLNWVDDTIQSGSMRPAWPILFCKTKPVMVKLSWSIP